MRVLLLQDVANVGQKFETHEVANGYGTNYLIPRGLARVATPEVEAQYKARKKELEVKREQQVAELAEALGELDGTRVEFTSRANEQGHLFAGISTEDIAEKLSEETGHEIKPDYIDLGHSLKEVGETDVEVTVKDQTATVTVAIEAE